MCCIYSESSRAVWYTESIVYRGGDGLTDFERYVNEYSRDLTRFCIRLCGDPNDAEDLFQDTWTRALSKLGQYDPALSFKSWLFAICVNIFRNNRKLKDNAARASLTAEEQERLLASIPDEQRDVDAYLDLYEALYTLPKKHRAVIILFYFREFSQREIAAILHIPEGTVKSRLNTARKLLQRRLSHE